MTSVPDSVGNDQTPEVSFVMPCYNEEDIVAHTILELLTAFEKAGRRLELIAVDNGSHDRTGEILRELASQHPNIVYHRVEVNEGYGRGVLSGLPLCTAPWIGAIVADGQVDAADVVKLFDVVSRAKNPKLAKVRRRFRTESLMRRIVSITYNMLARTLFGNLGTGDINASPKLIPRAYLERMQLCSKDWFLDAEIMIKARRLELAVFELSIFARMRAEGSSNVRPSTCWEFVVNMLSHRFGKKRKRLWVQPFSHAEQEGETNVDVKTQASLKVRQ